MKGVVEGAMPISERPLWAVCPPPDSNQLPRLYRSSATANRFLRSRLSGVLPTRLEPGVLNELRARVAERRKQRDEVERQIERGERTPFSYPPQLLAKRYRDCGWTLLPISSLSAHSGSSNVIRLEAFFATKTLDPLVGLTIEEELERALQNRYGTYSCFLSSDWLFCKIEAAVTELWLDHPYAVPPDADASAILLQVIIMLDTVLRETYPNASAAALADFWSSWQVWKYIAKFCTRFRDSEIALRLAGGNSFLSRLELKNAQTLLCRWLTQFAFELRTRDGRAELSEVLGSKKSSQLAKPTQESVLVRRFQQREGKRLGIEPSEKEICRSIPVDESTYYEWKRGGNSSKKATANVRKRIQDFLKYRQIQKDLTATR
jgi:hypothetical protein